LKYIDLRQHEWVIEKKENVTIWAGNGTSKSPTEEIVVSERENSTNAKTSGETVAEVLLDIKEVVNIFFSHLKQSTRVCISSPLRVYLKILKTLVIQVDFES
jgi:hypothetical protein